MVKNLVWIEPMRIEHERPKLQKQPFTTNVYDSWNRAQKQEANTNYTNFTICQHWKPTWETKTKCGNCEEVEAVYDKRKEVKISSEVKDDSNKYWVKVRGSYAEIWSSGDVSNMGTVGEKDERPVKRKMDEIDSGKFKQAKVKSSNGSSNEDSDEEVHELIEITSTEGTPDRIIQSIES
ncbi:hypothetical protein V491_02355 [Pseudogymnoascus sp. VKM F-3775]|nr:hypothetical protein V491_02355 [Pseudogymnoascus sp. VKM F-3775]